MGTTLAGAEELAAISTGTVLCLDEAGQSREVTKLPQLLCEILIRPRRYPARAGLPADDLVNPRTGQRRRPLRAFVEGGGGTYASGLDRRFDLNLGTLQELPRDVAERINTRAQTVLPVVAAGGWVALFTRTALMEGAARPCDGGVLAEQRPPRPAGRSQTTGSPAADGRLCPRRWSPAGEFGHRTRHRVGLGLRGFRCRRDE